MRRTRLAFAILLLTAAADRVAAQGAPARTSLPQLPASQAATAQPAPTSASLAETTPAEVTSEQTEKLQEQQPTSAGYQDRIIAPNQLAALPKGEDDEENDDKGLPRSLQAGLIFNRSELDRTTTNESGVTLDAFWETTAFGSFSANALAFRSDRKRDSGWRGTATLWQRGLYMPGGWLVNNGLGVQNTPLPTLLRQPYRFFLPSTPFAGISSEWNQRDRGLQWQAAIGRGGTFSGNRFSGFDLGDGNLLSLNMQWAWNRQASAALALLATDGRIVPSDRGLRRFQNGKSTALLFGQHWQGTQDALDVYLQGSRSRNGLSEDNNAAGVWFDAASTRGFYSHRYGLFYLQPDLAWGALPINNDVRGGYYRLAFQRARWAWNAGVDRIASISGNSFDGLYSSGFLRYQASPRFGIGASLSVRNASSKTAYSLQTFADRNSAWGQSRLQLDHADDGDGGKSWQVLLDHALPLQEGARLSLSAGYRNDSRNDSRGGSGSTRTAILAAYGGFDVTDHLSIDGTVRWNRGDGREALRTTDLNLAANWRLSTHWTLSGTLYQNQGSRRSPFNLDPLADPNAFESLPRDRSIFLELRYARTSGRRQAVMGSAPGSPAGSIAGSVFLDANGDGTRSATELPAENITVILDDRFQARTDAQGRFEFAAVGVGKHRIEIVADNLPLPWFIDEAQTSREFDVEVRRTTRIEIGAKQQH